MTTPSQSLVARYRDAAIALLPPGEAFSKRIYGPLAELLESFSVEWARAHELADRLLVNFNPQTADEMLPEWEETVGIAASGTTAERQNAVVTKLRGRTSHSRATFEDAALQLGFGSARWLSFAGPNVGLRFQAPAQFVSGRWRFKYTADRSHTVLGALGYFVVSVDTGAGLMIWPPDGSSPNAAYAQYYTRGSSVSAKIPLQFAANDVITFDIDNEAGTITTTSPANGTVVTTVAAGKTLRWPPGEYMVADRETWQGVTDNLVLRGAVSDFEAFDRTGIRWVQYPAATAGHLRAGDAITNDEWANVVRAYIPYGGESLAARGALRAAWTYLSRSHGWVDIVFLGLGGVVFRSGTATGQALGIAALINTAPNAELPDPPTGYSYAVDSAGNFLLDSAGNYLLVKAT